MIESLHLSFAFILTGKAILLPPQESLGLEFHYFDTVVLVHSFDYVYLSLCEKVQILGLKFFLKQHVVKFESQLGALFLHHLSRDERNVFEK